MKNTSTRYVLFTTVAVQGLQYSTEVALIIKNSKNKKKFFEMLCQKQKMAVFLFLANRENPLTTRNR